MPDLFPYQEMGARFLAEGRYRLLADEMGLGKSPQAVRAADLHNEGWVTVICPAIMCSTWLDTFRDFGDYPRSVGAVGGRVPNSDALACSYDRASNPATAQFLANRGGHLIIDEAHYIKEITSKRTRATLFIAEKADRVSFLTGTPILNHAGELFPLLRSAGRVKCRFDQFLHRYCVTRETDYGFSVVAHKNVEELRGLLEGFMLRRRNAVELPPTRYLELRADLSQCDTNSDAFRALRQLAPSAARTAAMVARSGNIRILDNDETARVERLIGVLKAPIAAREAIDVLDRCITNKIVLFAKHTAVIEALSQVLKPWGLIVLDGNTPEKQRRIRVKQFQENPAVRVAVCQRQAAGVGVTLTAANHLRNVEPSWTPADNDQIAKRIVRIGQRRPTTIGNWILTGSLDDAKRAVLERKARIIAEIIE